MLTQQKSGGPSRVNAFFSLTPIGNTGIDATVASGLRTPNEQAQSFSAFQLFSFCSESEFHEWSMYLLRSRSGVQDYIEIFYNLKRPHRSATQLSLVEYEKAIP